MARLQLMTEAEYERILNVFSDNHVAQALYRKSGYAVTNMNMQKLLIAEDKEGGA